MREMDICPSFIRQYCNLLNGIQIRGSKHNQWLIVLDLRFFHKFPIFETFFAQNALMLSSTQKFPSITLTLYVVYKHKVSAKEEPQKNFFHLCHILKVVLQVLLQFPHIYKVVNKCTLPNFRFCGLMKSLRVKQRFKICNILCKQKSKVEHRS